MAILKLKDSYGNIYEVPAIKGADGKDGVGIKEMLVLQDGETDKPVAVTFLMTDGTSKEIPIVHGEDGANGVGIASIEQAEDISNGAQSSTLYDINLTDGTSYMIEVKHGNTPVKGTDYWTEEDKEEIKAYVDEAILGGAW